MFKTGIVLHYIKDYSINTFSKALNEILQAKDSEILENDNISVDDYSMINFVKNLPIGTVICKNLTYNEDTIIVCLPVFSSHMSLPVKPGEKIWYFVDSENSFEDDIANTFPMLSVKNYWVSRKIGTKISEDLNFTHVQRDSLVKTTSDNPENIIDNFEGEDVNSKKLKKDAIELEKNKIRVPDFKNYFAYTNRYGNILPKIESVYDNSLYRETFTNSVPRWNSKSHEFTLQGSNNALLNLTKNKNEEEINTSGKGAVDIVAGRHSIVEFLEKNNEDFFEIEFKNNKFIENLPQNIQESYGNIKIDLTNPLITILNSKLQKEVLKDQIYYLREEVLNQVPEGETSINNDASRIYISEFDRVDNIEFYDTSFMTRQKIAIYEEGTNFEEEISKEYLPKEKILINNLGAQELEAKDNLLPTIFLKTNNIRLIARSKKENKLEEKVLDEGSIRLVKESNQFLSHSHINLESNGDVLIDGNTILLGNFQKELVKQKIVENENEFITIDDAQKTQKMIGNGSGLLIGYDPEFAEPLVLGETLRATISELININIFLADELKKVTDALQSHVHIGIPGSGISGIPQKPTPYVDFGLAHNDATTKYSNIKNNLRDILSKFAKTT